MKAQIEKLMFEAPAFGENAFLAKGGVHLAPCDQFPANSANIPAVATAFNGQYITLSRIGQACDASPNFTMKGYDINGCAYGTLYANGEEAKWRCNGETVWTDLNTDDDEDFFTQQELYRLLLYPFVAWYEDKNPQTKDFREKYRKHLATTDDCLLFSMAFQYGFAKKQPEVECVVACSTKLCEPAVEQDIVVQPAGTTDITRNGLPWQSNTENPTSLTIQSAMEGKFNLKGQWGIVEHNGKSYDFNADMVNPAEMEDYIDNEDFHDNLQQLVGYIGSLFRTNNLVWDGTPMNKFLEQKNIPMRRSNQQNIMLAGEPGSGKTLLCRMLAAALGMPCLIIRLGERSEKDELTQEVVATDHGFDTIKSKLYWYVRHGGLVVFDDLSNADPNMFFTVTGGLLESPYEYSVNQETVKRHPLCIMLATTNVGTIGSQPMNEALLTRFGGHYVVERLSDDAFKQCIISRAQSNAGVTVKPKTQKQIADWTFNVFNSVSRAIKTVDRETADRLITMRAAIATAEKILNAVADGFPTDCKKAARQTMANILYTGGNPTLQKSVADAIDSAPSITI
ncbi:MAG: AAA family ATPase [Bacteroidaceae bacterium]|nr:AAA family ATPase [Bacteroidaceae bacterium]